MKKLFLLFVPLFMTLNAYALNVQVYTGTLNYTDSNRVMLVRMFFIPKVNSNVPDIEMNLYSGGFNSQEISPVFFDMVTQQSDGMLILSDRRSQNDMSMLRSPTLFIKITPDGDIEGEFTSPDIGPAGTVRLLKGWSLNPDMLKGKLVNPAFEGAYDALCSGLGNSRVAELLEVIGTRSKVRDLAQIPGADTTVKSTTYFSAVACKPGGYSDSTQTNCATFDHGNYDHYTGRFNLYAGQWQTSCSVSPDGNLDCKGPSHQDCVFTRYKDRNAAPMDTIGSKPPFLKDPAPPTPFVSDPAPSGDCAELNGKIPGILTHANTGLIQRVLLDTKTVETTIDGVTACQFIGAIRLYFNAREYPDVPPMSHVLGDSYYVPSKQVGRLTAPMVGDVNVYFWKDGKDWKGHWYSRINGLIGDITFGKNVTPPSNDEKIFVPSFTGIYVQNPQHGIRIERTMILNAVGDTSDAQSFDPSRQFKTTGSQELRVVSPNGDEGMRSFASIDLVTYNYFTGFAVFLTPNHYWKARVYPDKLIAKSMSRRFGADYAPVYRTWNFERTHE